MSADLARIAQDPSIIDRAGDPGVFIIQACERGRTWLREALEHGDIDQIAEIKATAEAVRIYTVSKNYGEDAKVSATELVRRAEQGIGRAVRKGQEDDEVRKVGRPQKIGTGGSNFSPADYLAPGRERTEAYAMVDGISDEQFEEALAEAKEEGNLSRTNVARKARALANGQAPPASPSPKGGGRPPRGRASRRPLPDFANEVGWSLRQDVEKLERIFADDRFAYNKQQVAAQVRGHLTYAIQVCQDLLDRINQTPGE